MFGNPIVADTERSTVFWDYLSASSFIKIFSNYHIPSLLLRGALHFDNAETG